MTRFLLFLSILGAAIYGLLIYTHDVLTDKMAEKTYTEQTHPNDPFQHLSSLLTSSLWDYYGVEQRLHILLVRQFALIKRQPLHGGYTKGKGLSDQVIAAYCIYHRLIVPSARRSI